VKQLDNIKCILVIPIKVSMGNIIYVGNSFGRSKNLNLKKT
jgi:hypothetical protein